MVSGIYQQPKDPEETLDYEWDFGPELDTDAGEAIAARTVTVSGVTLDSYEFSGTKVIAWLSGGTAGSTASITFEVTTNNSTPRTIQRTALLHIRER